MICVLLACVGSPASAQVATGTVLGTDVAFFRNFSFHERASLQVRSEFTNSFSMVNLSAPNASLNSTNVGKITTASTMRRIQLGLRVTF
jgi:hypothetical protein